MNNYKNTIFLVVISFASFNVNAELFKWTDKEGKFHISDRPPLDPNKVKMENKKSIKRAIKKQQKKPDKTVIAWRCKELEDQYDVAMNKAIRFSTNKNLAATMKADAENYKLALDQICR